MIRFSLRKRVYSVWVLPSLTSRAFSVLHQAGRRESSCTRRAHACAGLTGTSACVQLRWTDVSRGGTWENPQKRLSWAHWFLRNTTWCLFQRLKGKGLGFRSTLHNFARCPLCQVHRNWPCPALALRSGKTFTALSCLQDLREGVEAKQVLNGAAGRWSPFCLTFKNGARTCVW